MWSPGTVSGLAWVTNIEMVNYLIDNLTSIKKPAFSCFLSLSTSKIYFFIYQITHKNCASWTEIADIMYEDWALFAGWPKSWQYVSFNPAPQHAQAKENAVLNPKYLFSFAFLSGTDDPFQHGGETGVRHEETDDNREEDVLRKE